MFGTTETGKHRRQEDNGEHNTNSVGVRKVKDTDTGSSDCHATEFSVKCVPFLHRSSCDTAVMNQNIQLYNIH